MNEWILVLSLTPIILYTLHTLHYISFHYLLLKNDTKDERETRHLKKISFVLTSLTIFCPLIWVSNFMFKDNDDYRKGGYIVNGLLLILFHPKKFSWTTLPQTKRERKKEITSKEESIFPRKKLRLEQLLVSIPFSLSWPLMLLMTHSHGLPFLVHHQLNTNPISLIVSSKKIIYFSL